MSDDLNDDAAEAFFSGGAQDEPLGRLLASIADHYASIPPPPPGPELAALMTDRPADSGAVDRSITRRRRKRVVAAALTGTALGKVVIGVSAAAASVAGMQASGIVQLPGLPGAHTSSAPATTITTTSSPTTSTAPTIDPEFTRRLQVRDAGSVVFAVGDDEFLWIHPSASAGWTHTLRQRPMAAVVTFGAASGTVTVDATIEGDFLHVIVLDQRDGSSDEYWFDSDGRPTDDPNRRTNVAAAPDPETPPAPVPVDDADEVRSGDDDHQTDDDHEFDDEFDDDHEFDDDDEVDDDEVDDDRSDEPGADRDDEDDAERDDEDDAERDDEDDAERDDEDDEERGDDRLQSSSDDGTSDVRQIDVDPRSDDHGDDSDD
jgi:hypothetical protein